ncbi:MAG TPA: hypothetical protein VGI39_29060, partial [Polyangiaceae bacterium]
MQRLSLRLLAVVLVAATPAVVTVAGCGSLAPDTPAHDSGVPGEAYDGGAGSGDATSAADAG